MHTNMRGCSNNFHRVSPEILNSAQSVASYVFIRGQNEAEIQYYNFIFQPIMAESTKCFVNPKVSKN